MRCARTATLLATGGAGQVFRETTNPAYPHYETLVRSWGPTPLDDERLAAGLMWFIGDLIFLSALMAIIAGWIRTDARDSARTDRYAAVEMAEICVREQKLAERLARERGETPG